MTKIHITLIHGTFGYKTPWIDLENGFCKKLKESFGADYEIEYDNKFNWGQKLKWLQPLDNTLYARINGANNLEKHLLLNKRDNHFVIAHSHGGNVVLYAMKNKEVADSIDGLVCIGTPFLDHEEIPSIWSLLWLSTGVMLLFSWNSDFSVLKLYSTLFGIFVALIYAFKYIFKIGEDIAPHDKFDLTKSNNGLSWNLKVLVFKLFFKKGKNTDLLEKFDLPSSNYWSTWKTKILVLFTEGDEAYRALNISSDYLDKIRLKLSKGTNCLDMLNGIMIISGVILFGLSYVPNSSDFIDAYSDYRLFFENWLIIPLAFLMSFLVIISCIINFVHGIEYSLWVLKLKLLVKPTLGWDNVINKPVEIDSEQGSKHSLIREKSVDDISNWIKSQI